MTGAELRAARKAAKLTQVDLAKQAGVCRDTVQYWEAKAQIGRHGAWHLMAEVLGLRINRSTIARTGGWGVSCADDERAQTFGAVSLPDYVRPCAQYTHAGGWGLILSEQEQAKIAAMVSQAKEREAQATARRRVICGAKTRKGRQCRNKSEPGKRRCKFHGGKSTGPKTPEGRARIAEAQRRRWALARACGNGTNAVLCG